MAGPISLILIVLLSTLVATCLCEGSSSQVNVISAQCGKPSVPPKKPKPGRIVGGEESNPNSWPWQVSLQVFGSHHCGGSLLDATHVVTAAHCVEDLQAKNFKILAGLHDRRAPQSSYQVVEVANITAHQNYTVYPQSATNDIAIMTLASPVRFNANVSAICLAEDAPSEGQTCIATGWGDTKGTGNDKLLLQVALPIVPASVCNDTDHYEGLIEETMTCAGVTGKDSCQGDSGGPLVCQRPDGIWELHGVTSWGHGCGRVNNPGVYARVTYFKRWINENI